MFLRSLEIKNYRSLESVKLDKLTSFNVLIGKNNSGKSSVFGALALLNSTIRGQPVEWQTVLTGMEPSRSLELRLLFSIRPEEREEFIRMVWPDEDEETIREQVRNSPFFRQIEYFFKSTAGSPHLLHLTQMSALAGDGRWIPIQTMRGDVSTNNPQSYFKQIGSTSSRKEKFLSSDLLDIRILENHDVAMLQTSWAHNNQYMAGSGLNSEVVRWPLAKLAAYLDKAFFFNPFRHSQPRLSVALTEKLAQDGANLAQVLHTINSGNRDLFSNIEKFVHEALPDIGRLQTPLLPSQETEVAFRSRDGGYNVRLENMGGGVQQLLMVATVLLTTGFESTIFIEEPESHLHAGAQRFLIERLYQEERQIFITTHSPTFINQSRPSSMYQIKYAANRTAITPLDDANVLSAMLADIGSRNSDVLLSNAVLFVEGPGDGAAINIWSKTLGMSLEEHNITLFPMGGGEHAERSTKVRSQVLAGISKKAPVPHLFVLDRDERRQSEIENLQQALGDRLILLQARELENYLLSPRALMAALRSKCKDDPSIMNRLEEANPEEVKALIHATADKLYGLILLKRVRVEIAGLPGGLFPRESATTLASEAQEDDLAKIILQVVEQRLERHVGDLNIPKIVQAQKDVLDKEWVDIARRVQIAPGEEIVAAVFKHFGSEYRKPGDTGRIAKEMSQDEIPPEIKELICKAAALSLAKL